VTQFTKIITIGAYLALIGSQAALAQTNHQSVNQAQMDHSEHSQTATDSNPNVQIAEGLGTLADIFSDNRKIAMKHDPIKSLSWPAMKMNFAVDGEIDLAKLKSGGRVQFTLRIQNKNQYLITELCRTDKSKVVSGICKRTASETTAADHDNSETHDH